MTADRKRPNTVIRIDLGEIELTHEELWPDWDGEATLTAEDVVDMIDCDGGLRVVLSAWNLISGSYPVTVTTSEPNPAYGGDTVLFGDPPPKVLVTETTADVS